MVLSKRARPAEGFAAHGPWVAFNMACMTWPVLRTQWMQYVAIPEALQRVQETGIAGLEAALPGLTEKLGAVQQGRAFARELERLQTTDVRVLTLLDADYPPTLRWIPDPPPLIYVRGTLQDDDSLALAIVGSRKPSPYGQAVAQRFSVELVQAGFTVVSGLARGIDYLAHHRALEAGGRTIAVLGSGINVVYPPEHRRLYEAIGAHGVVVSEFPFDTKPDRWNFPRRNRIISGMALGTLVVEASDKSGSLHTARHAIEQGREVFAVPGRIDVPTSHGAHALIKRGAKLVESLADILEELSDDVREALRQRCMVSLTPAGADLPPDVTADEAQVLAVLSSEEMHIEALIAASQLPAQVVASILLTLELRGMVRQFPGSFFARC